MKTELVLSAVVLSGGFVSVRHPTVSIAKPAIPANGSSYFGFTLRNWDGPALVDPVFGDLRPFPERYADSVQYETAQKLPSVFGVPTIWQETSGVFDDFNSAVLWQIQENQIARPDAMPFITWNAQTGWDVSNPGYAGITTKTINSGALDGYIRTFADQVKAYQRPVFIRLICGEVNGSWWKNCSPLANPSLTANDFIQAWRRVVGICRQRGATNIAWVWNVNTFPPPPAYWFIDSNIADYYPGNSYVDWAGADHYDFGPVNWLDPITAFVVGKGKPFFLAEWGIRHPSSTLTPAQQQAWLGDMFTYVAAHSAIKAVLYFNYNSRSNGVGETVLYGGLVNYHSKTNDADSRLLAESGASFRAAAAAGFADARYR